MIKSKGLCFDFFSKLKYTICLVATKTQRHKEMTKGKKMVQVGLRAGNRPRTGGL